MNRIVRALLLTASFFGVFTLAPAAQAETLAVANVGAPAINCFFNASCAVTVTDSVGAIPLPGIAAQGRLQSRTYVGAPGTPGAGLTAYEYRVDLTHVRSAPRRCVSALWVFSGYPSARQFDGAGGVENVFVITSGGLGSIGVASATQEGEGTKFTFTRPVCGGVRGRRGDSSFFFGFVSASAPIARTTYVHTHVGPAGPLVTANDVPVRSPNYFD